MKKIGFIVGSLRNNSFSKRWAENIARLLPEAYEPVFPEIGDLDLYNEDLDAQDHMVPESYKRFRDQMSDIDGVVFVSPEYNRSIPAVVKNALDVGSRPYGASVWDGKPAMVVSHSIGSMAGMAANHHLRQALVFLNMPVLQQPEMYLENSAESLDDDGKIIRDGSEEFLQNAVDTYISFLEKLI